MPTIIVQTDGTESTPPTVIYHERLGQAALESGRFAGQLVDRIRLALAQAEELDGHEGRTPDPA